jgi:hypothetical protein
MVAAGPAFCFTAAISVFAAGPEECGFCPVISNPVCRLQSERRSWLGLFVWLPSTMPLQLRSHREDSACLECLPTDVVTFEAVLLPDRHRVVFSPPLKLLFCFDGFVPKLYMLEILDCCCRRRFEVDGTTDLIVGRADPLQASSEAARNVPIAIHLSQSCQAS